MTVALGSVPSKPLPIIVRPIVDELLSSWLRRTAHILLGKRSRRSSALRHPLAKSIEAGGLCSVGSGQGEAGMGAPYERREDS
jgi:hypothetical protein